MIDLISVYSCVLGRLWQFNDVLLEVVPPLLVCVELNPGPPKMTDEKRSEVIGYLKAGKNAAEAAQEFHVDKSSVKRLKQNFTLAHPFLRSPHESSLLLRSPELSLLRSPED